MACRCEKYDSGEEYSHLSQDLYCLYLTLKAPIKAKTQSFSALVLSSIILSYYVLEMMYPSNWACPERREKVNNLSRMVISIAYTFLMMSQIEHSEKSLQKCPISSLDVTRSKCLTEVANPFQTTTKMLNLRCPSVDGTKRKTRVHSVRTVCLSFGCQEGKAATSKGCDPGARMGDRNRMRGGGGRVWGGGKGRMGDRWRD